MSRPDPPAVAAGTDPDLLTGWKEIAAYLGKSVRTAQRWESHNGLPVQRVQPLGDVVFARRSQLDQWRDTPRGAATLEVVAHEAPGELASEEASPASPIGPELTSSGGSAQEHSPSEVEGPAVTNPGLLRRSPRWLPRAFVGSLVAAALLLAGWRLTISRDQFALIADPPDPRMQGQTFMMTVEGFSPANPVTRWTRLPNGREEALPPPLRPDESGEIRWGFTTDCNTETGTHYLWMQQGERRSEPSRVVVLANPACERPMPDLAARVLGTDTASVPAGGTITVRFTVWNMGNADAVATQTRVRLSMHSARTAVTDTPLGDVPVEALPVGASATKTAPVTIPATTVPGIYYLWVIADNGNATIEPTSFNNFARSHAFVVTSR